MTAALSCQSASPPSTEHAPPSAIVPAPAKCDSLAAPDPRSLPLRFRSVPIPKTVYAPPAGDGCTTPRAFQVHGSLGGESVRGTLSLQTRRVTLELLSIASGTKKTYQGRLGESVCRTSSLEYSGEIVAGAGPHAALALSLRLPWSLNPPTNSEPERTRLEIEGRDQAEQEPPPLELWDAPIDPRGVLDPYRNALSTAVDIQSVVRAPNGSTFIAYSPAGSTTLSLAELSGSPLARKRAVETGLECKQGDDCSTELFGYEVVGDTVALVVTLRGSGSRGQGNFRSGSGELWMSGPEGFELGASLPTTESSDTAHGSSGSFTGLYWTDSDGAPPLEILVRHRDSQADSPDFHLLAFDPARKGYQPIDRPLETPQETLVKLSYGSGLAAF